MTNRVLIGFLGLAVGMGFLVCPKDGAAEWYVDAYAGAGWTASPDLTITSSLGTTTTYHHLHVNNNWMAGARGGYWLDKEKMDWLGFGLDPFFFHLRTPPGVQVGVTGSGGSTSQSANGSLPAWESVLMCSASGSRFFETNNLFMDAYNRISPPDLPSLLPTPVRIHLFSRADKAPRAFPSEPKPMPE